jgi:hypothetical protein
LAGVASGGIGIALAASEPAPAQTTPAPAQTTQSPAHATPSPGPSGSGKPPGAIAVAAALSMKRFDSTLSDAELQTIAKAIDGNNDAALTLNPKKKRLKNGDAPIVRFEVAGGEA